MGATNDRGYRYPELATAPPDAATWIKTGLSDVDDDMVLTLAQITAINNKLKYGPVASAPTTLPPGYFYFGY